MNTIDEELEKVRAVTTLCHLCTLEELNDFVKQIKTKRHGHKSKSRRTAKA